jgi:hypothetical protein
VDWPFFHDLIDDESATSQHSLFTGLEGKSIELEMNTGIDRQELFYYGKQNQLIGRTFEHCDNFMVLAFTPTPRKLGTIRVSLCPLVRSKRKRLEFSVLNQEREITFNSPERLYDCNLRVDVPLDSFLIVSPASQAKFSTSIGGAFLMSDGDAYRIENVLLFVPRPFAVDARAQVAQKK